MGQLNASIYPTHPYAQGTPPHRTPNSMPRNASEHDDDDDDGHFDQDPFDESKHPNLNSFFHKSGRKQNDKSDRATTDQVLDPRTRTILSKMINSGLVSQVNGCISTGKEANVYQADLPNGQGSAAIKIYKTSILIFKDRDRYVTGEYRFRNGYCRSNPRKMVKMWAEKEMRNLKRLVTAGIPCPEPRFLKLHVLMMDFIGDSIGCVPAPRLKDAELMGLEEAEGCYWQIVHLVRKMYHSCKLVHADLSEYNLLWWQKKIWIIDVGQAVEHDHPASFDFLRHDCSVISGFFRGKGVATLTVREFFDHVTTPMLQEQPEEFQSRMIPVLRGRGVDFEQRMRIDEQVFKQAFIPKRLDQVPDVEGDLQKIQEGHEEEVLYHKIAGISLCKSEESDDDDSDWSESCESSDNQSQDSDCEMQQSDSQNQLTLQEKRLQRKKHKQQVKAENRERRKTKMKKAVKARLTRKRR
jgi:RIO kinase 1